MKSVSLDLRSAFEKEITKFVKELGLFIDGKGDMPKTNTEAIKNNYIQLGVAELVKHGAKKPQALKVSKYTFETLLTQMMV